jgi:hypothetical protein
MVLQYNTNRQGLAYTMATQSQVCGLRARGYTPHAALVRRSSSFRVPWRLIACNTPAAASRWWRCFGKWGGGLLDLTAAGKDILYVGSSWAAGRGVTVAARRHLFWWIVYPITKIDGIVCAWSYRCTGTKLLQIAKSLSKSQSSFDPLAGWCGC